jgi:hypothetical protein
MKQLKLDEKQKQIEFEDIVDQYFHEQEENYLELIELEIMIDSFPIKYK